MTINNIDLPKINKNNYITYRRRLLDYYLDQHTPEMRGMVIDLGGKHEQKRGSFTPPEKQASAWYYVNLELGTHPNLLGDVCKIPIKNNCADIIICTEVLEHLKYPNICADEIFRILRPGGSALLSIPFLYPVHADPYDFQRYTADGLRQLLNQFNTVEITPMGGYLGTLGMLIEIGIPGIKGQRLDKKIIRRFLYWFANRLCLLDLNKPQWANPIWQKFTTGYFIKAIK